MMESEEYPIGCTLLPGDWPEDFKYENGCYMNRCYHCNSSFLGHKRRFVCKVCVERLPSAPEDATMVT